MSVTECTYDEAIRKLHARYNDPEKLTTAYCNELKEVKHSAEPS